MPIYEYRCKQCNKVNEFLIKHSKKIELSCPECNSSDLVKQISVPGGLFTKGSASTPDLPCSSGGCQPGPMCGSGIPGTCGH